MQSNGDIGRGPVKDHTQDLLPHIIHWQAHTDPTEGHRRHTIPFAKPRCKVERCQLQRLCKRHQWCRMVDTPPTYVLSKHPHSGLHWLQWSMIPYLYSRRLQGRLEVIPRVSTQQYCKSSPPIPIDRYQSLVGHKTTHTACGYSCSKCDGESISNPSAWSVAIWTTQSYQASVIDSGDDPLAVLHTSGSTWLPKPTTRTHSYVDALRKTMTFPAELGEPPVKQEFANTRANNGLPLLHVHASLYHPMFLLASMSCRIGVQVVRRCVPRLRVASAAPRTPNSWMNGIRCNKIESSKRLSPNLHAWRNHQARVPPAANRAIRICCVRRGIFSLTCGQCFEHKRLVHAIGATEYLVLQGLPVAKEDWEFLRPHLCMGIDVRHHSDNVFEAVFVRIPHIERYRSIWHVLSECQEYRGDLFTRHPHKEGLCIYAGRADDLLVFATG